MASDCYFTYMTFILFYLVFCFSKNRHQGEIFYEESLSQLEQTNEEALSETQKLQKNYWRWLMNGITYFEVEHASLDQAVLQEYVDIASIRQQLSAQSRNNFIDIEELHTKIYSQSLIVQTDEFDFRDKD